MKLILVLLASITLVSCVGYPADYSHNTLGISGSYGNGGNRVNLGYGNSSGYSRYPSYGHYRPYAVYPTYYNPLGNYYHYDPKGVSCRPIVLAPCY